MRISDWSSCVCSSDLIMRVDRGDPPLGDPAFDDRDPRRGPLAQGGLQVVLDDRRPLDDLVGPDLGTQRRAARDVHLGVDVAGEIGRASGRERVCKYVSISVVAVSFKKETENKD